MRSECAWCGRRIEEVPPFEDDRVTHGICPACAAKRLPGFPLSAESANRPDGAPESGKDARSGNLDTG